MDSTLKGQYPNSTMDSTLISKLVMGETKVFKTFNQLIEFSCKIINYFEAFQMPQAGQNTVNATANVS